MSLAGQAAELGLHLARSLRASPPDHTHVRGPGVRDLPRRHRPDRRRTARSFSGRCRIPFKSASGGFGQHRAQVGHGVRWRALGRPEPSGSCACFSTGSWITFPGATASSFPHCLLKASPPRFSTPRENHSRKCFVDPRRLEGREWIYLELEPGDPPDEFSRRQAEAHAKYTQETRAEAARAPAPASWKSASEWSGKTRLTPFTLPPFPEWRNGRGSSITWADAWKRRRFTAIT